MKYVQKAFDIVFSLEMFLVLCGVVFVSSLLIMGNSHNEAAKQTRQMTEACYKRGMVLVDTDAGRRCVDPRNLVKAN